MNKHVPNRLELGDASRANRIDSICDAFEQAWGDGQHPHIEDFLNQSSPEDRSTLLKELLAVEVEHRRRAGEKVSTEDYVARFPDEADAIQAALTLTDGRPSHIRTSSDTVIGDADHAASTLPPDVGHAPTQPSAVASSQLPRRFGDYELLSELGRGAMGLVYKARHLKLNRIVALKMILAGHFASPADTRRFQREAKAAACLDHPNIVPLHEVGRYEGQHFLAMGFVEGRSLADHIAQRRPSQRGAVALVARIALAIHYSHQRGVVHRDLKPANILVDKRGKPRVVDFGLAKQLQADDTLTATGDVLGTPSYMAPEQAAGDTDHIGPLSDVYALGAILYCLLTGRPPFQASNPLEILLQVVQDPPTPVRERNPAVDKDLETICLKCLEKDPGERYVSANALAEDLRRWLRSEPILARPVSRASRLWRWCNRNRVIALLSVAAMLALAFGLLSWTVQILNSRRSAERTLAAERTVKHEKGRTEQAKALAEQKSFEAAEQRNLAEKESTFARALAYNQQLLRAKEFLPSRPMRALSLLTDESVCPEDMREFTWGYLYRQANRVRETFRLPDVLSGVVFSPDGTLIAVTALPMMTQTGRWESSESHDALIHLWSVSERQLIKTLPRFDNSSTLPQAGTAISSLTFSPNGKELVSCTNSLKVNTEAKEAAFIRSRVTFQNIETGESRIFTESATDTFLSLAFSPSGTNCAILSSHIPTSRQTGLPRLHTIDLNIWDLDKGQIDSSLHLDLEQNPRPMQTNVLWSSDGESLVFGGANLESDCPELIIVDPESGQVRHAIKFPERQLQRVSATAFSPDGRLLVAGTVGGGEGGLAIVDVPSGKRLQVPFPTDDVCTAVGFSRDGERIVMGGAPNNNVIGKGGDYERILKIWNAATGELEADLSYRGEEPGKILSAMSMSPNDSTFVTTEVGGNVSIWNMDSTPVWNTVTDAQDTIPGSVGFSPDSKVLVAATTESILKVWHGLKDETQTTLSLGEDLSNTSIEQSAFLPNNSTVAILMKGRVNEHHEQRIVLVDLESGQRRALWGPFAGNVEDLSFSPDGRRLVIAYSVRDNSEIMAGIMDIDVDKGKPQDKKTGKGLVHIGPTCVEYSPRGDQIAIVGRPTSRGDRWCVFLDPTSLEIIGSLDAKLEDIGRVVFSADGSLLASLHFDGTIMIHDAVSHTTLRSLNGHNDYVSSAAFSPDGRTLVSAGHDNSIRLWDVQTGQARIVVPLASEPGHRVRAGLLAFSRDGRQIVVSVADSSTNGEARSWTPEIRVLEAEFPKGR